mmetsp:Transcript_7027/g.22961  ORF Transcript_7027/g.22961 Transcript_7027/m.22961 type:complete len:355 (+) Transcript_7027:253-1317(+)
MLLREPVRRSAFVVRRWSSGAYGPQPAALDRVNATARYASGPTTFFRLAYEAECEVGIVGVPYDGGVTNRPGARHGPRAVREASADHVRPVQMPSGASPFELARVADVGDLAVQRPFDIAGAHVEIEAGYRRMREKVSKLAAVGGDHSISLPILRALSGRRREKLGLVHVDAHADTGYEYLGSRFHHGSPFKVAVDEGLLEPTRCIQIGIRGTLAARDAWRFSYESGMRVVAMDDFEAFWARDHTLANLAAEVRAVVGTGPVYLTFDVDALDPAFAPGTGTPEPGGLSMRQAQTLLRAVQTLDLDVVGADIVEVSPPFCSGYLTAFNAANLLHDILCILTASTHSRRGSPSDIP